ncbi:DUF2515 family protein [Alicyclobacillus dauci]|uniref:DUF2515 domain-containing protein n=1 Tax=Alicyclobacillus dauci TaxID=1475485 RepID=A0ABY6Z4P9_9BACL|nr:DUF2515 family protein [Alicyclobacillus dauci]WAH37853.1 DUF2515 domain-containing protein [Alicyclobacillus dauci]
MSVLHGIANELRLIWRVVQGKNRGQIVSLVRRLQKARSTSVLPTLTPEEESLVREIRKVTEVHNRNNLTRTNAYLDFYLAHPEVHWALLAHMVSRNGGWSMTDVKGEWFSRIAETVDANRFFLFLERANWLIFGDAYPQLLVYAESVKRGRDLSHLLGHLGVSRFMEPIWPVFLQTQDSSLITRALIINEQNFIEGRVIQNAAYDFEVLLSIEFQAQSILGLNHVLMPFRKGDRVRVAGTTVKQFGSVDDRIRTGKRLYSILFRDNTMHRAIYDWAREVQHTGSREDYWPDRFSHTSRSNLSSRYEPIFLQDVSSHTRIYSPRLDEVWEDVQHPPAEPGDWFVDDRYVIYLFDPDPKHPADFTDTYVESIKTIEHLILAKEKLESLVALT